MTKETLQEANKLNHTITELEEQIKSVEEAQHNVDNRLALDIEYIDRITITGGLRNDILDMVISQLSETKNKMEAALKLL